MLDLTHEDDAALLAYPWCGSCGKICYPTWVAARNQVLRRVGYRVYLTTYRCPTDRAGFHTANIEKRIAKLLTKPSPSAHAELEELNREKNRLTEPRRYAYDRRPHWVKPITIDVGCERQKALNQKIHQSRLVLHSVRLLVHSLSGLPRHPAKLHRRRVAKPRAERLERREARVGLPRGATVTKMLAWANGCSYDARDLHPRHRGDDLRRRNRKREKAAVARELHREERDG